MTAGLNTNGIKASPFIKSPKSNELPRGVIEVLQDMVKSAVEKQTNQFKRVILIPNYQFLSSREYDIVLCV